jgi:hypothetical protein
MPHVITPGSREDSRLSLGERRDSGTGFSASVHNPKYKHELLVR